MKNGCYTKKDRWVPGDNYALTPKVALSQETVDTVLEMMYRRVTRLGAKMVKYPAQSKKWSSKHDQAMKEYLEFRNWVEQDFHVHLVPLADRLIRYIDNARLLFSPKNAKKARRNNFVDALECILGLKRN